MSIANQCYKRTDVDCKPVDQPGKILQQDLYGNEWYDFNADFIKNGVICDTESDPPTCEVLPVLEYKRMGLLDPVVVIHLSVMI